MDKTRFAIADVDSSEAISTLIAESASSLQWLVNITRNRNSLTPNFDVGNLSNHKRGNQTRISLVEGTPLVVLSKIETAERKQPKTL